MTYQNTLWGESQMKFRKLFWLTTLAMMALVFAACNTTGDAGGDNNGGDANASSAVDLSQTETVEAPEFGGSISVSYPEGWFFQGEGGAILISNNEEAITSSSMDDLSQIPEGTVVVTLSIIPAEATAAMGLGDAVTPASIIDTFSAFMPSEDMPEFGDVEELTIDGNPAARTTGSDDVASASMYAIDKGGNFTFGFGATRADEAGANAELIQAIIASATFTASE